MNEIQIIQQQLATERQHFTAVADAFAASLDTPRVAAAPTAVDSTEFVRACADYFAFALCGSEHGPRSEAMAKLDCARATATKTSWQDFLEAFNSELQKRFASLDALAARNPSITQWRVASRIDADSIFQERALYMRAKAALPANVTLGATAHSATCQADICQADI
jgi:hypothetical protein